MDSEPKAQSRHSFTAAPAQRSRKIDLERLFGEHNSSLLRFISAKIGSDQEAQEIAQEAYVHLLQLDRPETISHLRAFLFKTAHNLAIDRLRQRGRCSSFDPVKDQDFLVFELSPERLVAGEQEMAIFRVAVASLPAKCRRAFLLHRIYSLPIDEIATRMDIGACMVRRYISRAMDYIRYCLDAADSLDVAYKS